jgi:hypothetical protein
MNGEPLRHIIGQLGRRREAAQRLVPLDCSCDTRDPWTHKCTEPLPSENAIDGWRAAAEHLLSIGVAPLVPVDARKELWRRGGGDRALAQLLQRLAA